MINTYGSKINEDTVMKYISKGIVAIVCAFFSVTLFAQDVTVSPEVQAQQQKVDADIAALKADKEKLMQDLKQLKDDKIKLMQLQNQANRPAPATQTSPNTKPAK